MGRHWLLCNRGCRLCRLGGEVAAGDRSEGAPLVGKLTYAGFNLSMETESVRR